MTDQQQAIAALIEKIEAGECPPAMIRDAAVAEIRIVLSAHWGSLDAALALRDTLVHGFRITLRERSKASCGGWFCRVESPDFNFVNWEAGGEAGIDITSGFSEYATDPIPARALLIAILKAYNTTLGEVAA
jgi:hypothetical protein